MKDMRVVATESLNIYINFEYDIESGLYHLRARHYSPSTGTFISSDPIGFLGLDTNLYRYVFNNPINLTDPTGEAIPLLFVTAIAGLVIFEVSFDLTTLIIESYKGGFQKGRKAVIERSPLFGSSSSVVSSTIASSTVGPLGPVIQSLTNPDLLNALIQTNDRVRNIDRAAEGEGKGNKAACPKLKNE